MNKHHAIRIASLLVAALSVIATIAFPEIRELLGLSKQVPPIIDNSKTYTYEEHTHFETPQSDKKIRPTREEEASIEDNAETHHSNQPEFPLNPSKSTITGSTIAADKNEVEDKFDATKFVNSQSAMSDYTILMLEENNSINLALSNDIANLYRSKGISSSINLFKSTFVKSKYFVNLLEGESEIIENLNLKSFTKYLVIGKLRNSFRAGELVQGPHVCSTTLECIVISTDNNSIVNSFAIKESNGNGATKEQAKQFAITALLNNYYTNYIKI